MPAIELEKRGEVLLVRLNRPEKLNAINREMRTMLSQVWSDFHADRDSRLAILTGEGKAFCVGEDLVESAQQGVPDHGILDSEDPFSMRQGGKPIIAAINGYAMGGGFLLVENADLRIAVPGAQFEVSEAKRWLLGGYGHGRLANLSHAIATELALGFRFTGERLHELGFINRLASPETLLPEALAMAEHLLALPPAALFNTVHMMRRTRPAVEPRELKLAERLRAHGAQGDLVESRAAFAEKRRPRFKGWDNPADRYALPDFDDGAETPPGLPTSASARSGG